MPLVTTHRPTAASLVPDWAQAEDDGERASANVTALSSGHGLIQANGMIGDGPYGAVGSSGDFDIFTILVDDQDQTIKVDIDAASLGSGLNAAIDLYDPDGILQATSDNEAGVGIDPYVIYSVHGTNDTFGIWTVVIRASGSALLDLDNSQSGTGTTSRGAYRVLIANEDSSASDPDLYHGDPGNNAITYGNGNDVLVGNPGSDTLGGGGGNDLFVWNAGDGGDSIESVDGGAEFDCLEVNASSNSETFMVIVFIGNTSLIGMEGVAGGDQSISMANVEALDLRAFGGNDKFTIDDLSGTTLLGPIRFFAGSGNDQFNASAAVNNLVARGEAGNDRLNGGAAADSLDGGAGNDIVRGGAHGDLLFGRAGIDTVSYAGSSAAVRVNLATNAVSGGHAAADTISAFENVTGSSFADRLTGNKAANVLTGGGGGDILNGGAGRDTFDLNAAAESTVGLAGRDKINGFNRAQGDRIDLRTIDADQRAANPGNDVFIFIGSQTFAAYHAAHPGVFGMVRFAGGVLYGTVNGNMNPEFAISLTGVASLFAADIMA